MATNLTGFYLVFSGFFLMYFHFVLPAQVLRSPADLARRAEAVETGKKKRKNCHFLFRFHRSVSFWFFVLVFFWFFFAVLPSLMKKKRRVATSLANVINCVNRFQTSFVLFHFFF